MEPSMRYQHAGHKTKNNLAAVFCAAGISAFRLWVYGNSTTCGPLMQVRAVACLPAANYAIIVIQEIERCLTKS